MQLAKSTLALFLLLVIAVPTWAQAQPTPLAAGGKASLPIVISAKASIDVRQTAQTLGRYLERISGAKFEIVEGDGTKGIVLGRASSFPALPYGDLEKPNDPTRGEDYVLRSHAGGLHLIGASDQAVSHAVWDLLYRLGHRQFFPGETWEVVPKNPTLSVAVDVREHPSYYSRRIWFGFGTWDYNAGPYREWCQRNRAVAGIALSSGHAYDGIVSRHKAEFAAHPEYRGLIKGERKSHQFCVSNADLRKLVVADALKQMQENPDKQSLSLEPADGGGWCQCDKCLALGPPSNRALLLANEVAEAVNAKVGPRLVGMYAYSEHSPPPSLKVHPRVVISVATAFIRGGFSVDQLLDGWHKQGATLGIREYYSVHTWDRDLPGAARGSNLAYLQRTIPHFHSLGARYLSAESSDNWGPNGLGYYLAARMMWDVGEAKRVDALVADFLDKAFGPAKEPMAAFYKLLDGTKKPLLSDHLVGQMYRLLADARKRSDDPAIRKRLDELVQYVRYVELWLDYTALPSSSGGEGKGPTRQEAFEALIRHGYRMRKTMLIHAKALYRDLDARDKSVTIPKEAGWNVKEDKNPWKSSAPFTAAEIEEILAKGIANRQLFDFQPVGFSDNLVPADKLKLPEVTTGTMGLYSRGVRTYYTYLAKEPGSVSLKVQGGRIYGSRGPAKLELFPIAEPEGKAVDQADVPPDKQEHAVNLKTTYGGLHRLVLSDHAAGTIATWPDGLPMTVASSPEHPAALHGRWSLYFYVPRGTKIIGGFSSGPGKLLDGAGTTVHTFPKKAGYFSVPVPAGQDGKLWKFQQCIGQRLLMTVPPYLARSSRELLLPAEVVDRDAGR